MKAETNFFRKQILFWSQQFSHVCILDSNNYADTENNIDLLAGIGCVQEFSKPENSFEELKEFYNRYCLSGKNYLFGYFTYDLKNQIEKLNSNNVDDKIGRAHV